MGVLRRAPRAVAQFGAASGAVFTGVGGIGKTALAGRVMSRLRDDGWLIAVHDGRWNPTALIMATAVALSEKLPRPGDRESADALRAALAVLSDPDRDDGPKLGVIAALLEPRAAARRLR